MRDIKFRGIRATNNEWVFGGISQEENGTFIIEENAGVSWQTEVRPETVGQLIEFPASECGDHAHCYEGDEVLIQSSLLMEPNHGKKGNVVYQELGFYVDTGKALIPVWSDSYWLEVQGNIHFI